MTKIVASFVICLAVLVGSVLAPVARDSSTLKLLSRAEAVHAIQQGSVESPAYMEAFLEWVKSYVTNMLGGFVSSETAAIDKMISGRSQLQQANMNMEAAGDATVNFSEAGDKFNIAPERTCRTLNESMEARIALQLHEVNKKAITRQFTRRLSEGNNSAVATEEVLDVHNERYCSATDIDRGKCTKLSTMQNADTMASTLYVAEGSDTLSKEQYMAAEAFIKLATTPVPIEEVPRGLENTAAGQRFLLEKKQSVAMDSMVAGTFARALAARSPRN